MGTLPPTPFALSLSKGLHSPRVLSVSAKPPMTTIFCQYLKQELPAQSRAPYPGELGERLLREISDPAWRAWLDRQTTLINEKRLSPVDPKTRAYLKTQMLEFFFGSGGEVATGFVPPSA
jgi:Fe-S cluster biosynthesis and repair protein YggX